MSQQHRHTIIAVATVRFERLPAAAVCMVIVARVMGERENDGNEEVHAFAVKPVKELIVNPNKSETSKTGE